tara:strand:+ start:38800 stop:39699 length:900 start_codon:yes stop_codon:yes gene_type:complete
MLQLPSIDSIRCFRSAAELLNFRAAAKTVGLTAAAFGQRIQQLESELGAQLFERSTRHVALTEAGLKLLPFAERAIRATEDCVQIIRGQIKALPTNLVLGTRHELGLSWIVPHLPILESQHPSTQINLYFGSSDDLMLRLRSLELDCAISSNRISDPKLDFFALHEEKYAFVGSEHLLNRLPIRRTKDLRLHTLLDTGPNLPLFRYWKNSPNTTQEVDFDRVLYMGTIAAIRELVVANKGVALLPRYFVTADLQNGNMREILPSRRPLSDSFRFIFRKDDARRLLYGKLAESLRAIPLQ